jgi:dienelactone hydrolase
MIDADNMAGLARRLRGTVGFELARIRSQEPFAAWQAETIRLVRDALGAPTDAARAEILLRTPADGYVTDQLTLTFSNGETAAACLLTPDGAGPFPAVLLLHDHGSNFAIGKDKMMRPAVGAPSSQAAQNWVDRLYGGRFVGDELVRRGYVVLSVDALGWGSRAGNGYEAQQALAANLMQFGSSLAAVVAGEDVEATRFLAGLPQVDKNRVASFGFSFGGFRAWQVAALCDEIAATFCGGWMATLRGLMQPGSNQLRGQSAFYMLHPPLAGKLDYPDFAGLAAPKPALFFAGLDDRHFPPASVEEAFTALENIWTAAGHPENLETRLWPAAHVFPADQQVSAFKWLDRTFRR